MYTESSNAKHWAIPDYTNDSHTSYRDVSWVHCLRMVNSSWMSKYLNVRWGRLFFDCTIQNHSWTSGLPFCQGYGDCKNVWLHLINQVTVDWPVNVGDEKCLCMEKMLPFSCMCPFGLSKAVSDRPGLDV